RGVQSPGLRGGARGVPVHRAGGSGRPAGAIVHRLVASRARPARRGARGARAQPGVAAPGGAGLAGDGEAPGLREPPRRVGAGVAARVGDQPGVRRAALLPVGRAAGARGGGRGARRDAEVRGAAAALAGRRDDGDRSSGAGGAMIPHPPGSSIRRGRRAGAGFLAAALLFAGAGANACRRQESPRTTGRPGATAAPAPAPAGPAWIGWTDVTQAAGIGFRHVNGARGNRQMLETLGSGVCVFDADGDGRQDLFFVQSGTLPGDPPAALPARAALERNLGGRFEDVTAASGLLDEGHYGFGCVAGDIDGDGDRDLFVAGFGANRLYVNRGDGRFEERARAAGVEGGGWSTSAALFDADRDGDLDLYVARYVVYDLKQDLYCGENRPGYRTVCHPKNFDPEPDLFYR